MPDTTRHVDVSHLTDSECSHLIDVVQKDIMLRKAEADRISDLKKQLEDYRRSVLLANISRKKRFPFDDYCICGKHMFSFCFFITGEECASCENYCCSKCRKVILYNGKNGPEELYLCKLCSKKREVKRKMNAWFYNSAEKRFKRFGSSKVLRAIYKQNETIEPRIITLLALCRELQPVKRISLREMKQRVSSSTDICSYPSSLSEHVDSDHERKKSRRSHLSESELGTHVGDTHRSSSRHSRVRSAGDLQSSSTPLLNFSKYSSKSDAKLTMLQREDNSAV